MEDDERTTEVPPHSPTLLLASPLPSFWRRGRNHWFSGAVLGKGPGGAFDVGGGIHRWGCPLALAMATDSFRLASNARAIFALATVAALAFMGIAATIEITNPGREF